MIVKTITKEREVCFFLKKHAIRFRELSVQIIWYSMEYACAKSVKAYLPTLRYSRFGCKTQNGKFDFKLIFPFPPSPTPYPPHSLSLSRTLISLVFSIASQPPCGILPSSCARLSTRQSYLLKGQGCCYWFLTSLFDQCSYERLRHHWALTLAQSPCHGQLVIFRQTRCQRVDVLFIILLNFCICIKFSASRTNNLFLKTT